ncbi:hypothetical protein [Streptomyces sp. NPDC002845]
MNPSMDDRRILAEIERRLARDDPELVRLMDAINHQFPDELDDADSHSHGHSHSDSDNDSGRYDLCRRAIVALIIAAMTGLMLAAFFAEPHPADDNQGPPANGLAPAAAVDTPRRRPSVPDRHQASTVRSRERRQPNSLGRRTSHACT